MANITKVELTSVNKAIINKLKQITEKRVHVGFLNDQNHEGPRSKGLSNADLGVIQEYGTNIIPPRPFMATSVGDSKVVKTELSRISKTLVKSPEASMNSLGDSLSNKIKETMDDWGIPANEQSTINKKRNVGDNPLIETGNLRDSVSYEVRNNNRGD